MINRTVLTGRLTRDVDLRYTPSGAAVGNFTLAVDRQYTNQNNERETDFINCVIWRRSAENFANFTHKGSLVGIEGRLQTRNYENQQSQRVYVTEVVIDNFALLEPKPANNGSSSNNNYSNNATTVGNVSASKHNNSLEDPNTTGSDNNNQSSNENQTDPFANNGDSIDISDDDLPF